MSRKKTKQRTSDATARRRVLWAGIALVLAIGICVAVYEMYALNQNPIRTVTALEETVYDTIDTTGFMLRAEQCLDVDLSGYTVPFIQDGGRVPAGAEIAARFADAGSAQRYAQALQLRAEYDRYAALSAGTEYSSMKVEALMEKARLGVCDYLQAVAAGKIADAAAYESDFLDKETALEIAVSGSLDLSAKLAELSKKIEAQDASVGTYETLTTGADAGGYFFSETDGFEDTLSYADAEHLTVEQLEKAMAAEPASSKGGKIVKNHVWYITAILDAHDAESLAAVKGKVRIRFPQVGAEDVQATFYAANPDANGKSTVVFRCIEVSEQLLRLRKTQIVIVRGEKKGFKVPSSAVRILDRDGEQVRGVYVLRGNIVSFRKLNSVYAGEDFVLSAPKAESGYIKLYDEIITGGKDLHDGAVVYQ